MRGRSRVEQQTFDLCLVGHPGPRTVDAKSLALTEWEGARTSRCLQGGGHVRQTQVATGPVSRRDLLEKMAERVSAAAAAPPEVSVSEEITQGR